MRELNNKVIDLDIYRGISRFRFLQILFNLFRSVDELECRKSSGRGVHLVYEGSRIFQEIYSDHFKFDLDERRKEYGLQHSFLFDRRGKKESGKWQSIKGKKDILNIYREMYGTEGETQRS